MGKIISQKQIKDVSQLLRRKGKKIVTINGSYDILHADHIKTLTYAKNKGDILIVLMNSDKSVHLYKGPNRPIIEAKYRAAALAALNVVDYVVIFDDINPKRLLEIIKPHIHTGGVEYGKDPVERAVVERYGGRIVRLPPRIQGISTSNIIRKIVQLQKYPDARAVFLDRDGTINHNGKGYIYKKNDFIFLPGVLSALKTLSHSHYKIFIVTNQSGIGRGYFSRADLNKLHKWMTETLKKHKIRIDHIYFCPHAPNNHCECRKPKPGMIFKAVNEYKLSLSKSWFIGDDTRDIELGREVNLKTIKLGAHIPSAAKLSPHKYAKDLREAVNYVLAHS